MKKILLFIFVLLSFSFYAQVGIGTTSPDAGSMLDVTATDKGMLVPRVNLTNLATIAPVTGSTTTSLLVYNTNATTGTGFYYWDNAITRWVRIDGGRNWSLTGNAGTTAGTNFIGTTDAVDFRIRTNNADRWNVSNANSGQLQSYSLGTAALPIYSFQTDTNTGIFSSGADVLNISTSANERFRVSTTEAIFNDPSNNFDFRIESDGQDDMFFVDASTNRIGINTTTPANVIDFRTTGENIWLTYWENNQAANGAVGQFYHSNATNGNRVLMGATNYNGSTSAASAVIGLSLNNTATGSGGIGVYGGANNESGNAVQGNLSFTGTYSGWAGYFNADVYCGGTYFGSDRRLKRDIKPIQNALSLINKIEPVSYYFDTEKYPKIGLDENRLSYGFIAQDLEKVIPEMVKDKNLDINSTGLNTTDLSATNHSEMFKVVNYTLLIPILTEAVKEQQVIIEEQNKRIEKLEKAVEQLLKKK